MRLSSDDVPVMVSTATIKKHSGAKLYLFTDVLAVVQVTVYTMTSVLLVNVTFRVTCLQSIP